jgi:hypothetical protein
MHLAAIEGSSSGADLMELYRLSWRDWADNKKKVRVVYPRLEFKSDILRMWKKS